MSPPQRPLRASYAPPLVAFLRELGADRVRHSGRTFLDHLIGTAGVLEGWGYDDDVCKAGLFHSIYGTQYFRHAVLSNGDRPRVREYIGERAERLAWIFCAFDRRSIYTAIAGGDPYSVALLAHAGEVPITRQELADLIAVLWANAIEQVVPARLPADVRVRCSRELDQAQPYLPTVAVSELRAALNSTDEPGRSAGRG